MKLQSHLSLISVYQPLLLAVIIKVVVGLLASMAVAAFLPQVVFAAFWLELSLVSFVFEVFQALLHLWQARVRQTSLKCNNRIDLQRIPFLQRADHWQSTYPFFACCPV